MRRPLGYREVRCIDRNEQWQEGQLEGHSFTVIDKATRPSGGTLIEVIMTSCARRYNHIGNESGNVSRLHQKVSASAMEQYGKQSRIPRNVKLSDSESARREKRNKAS